MSGRHLAFPFKISSDGRTAAPKNLDDQVRGELIQSLLTNPGERPFLPSFGGGLRRLIFKGNDEVAAALAKATVSQALSYWLQDRLEGLSLDVRAENSTLRIDLRYRVIATGEERRVRFEHTP